jgi:hypothetical protein
MALANEADERRRQDALAVEQCRQESAERVAAMAENALAAEQRRQESAKHAAETESRLNALQQRRRTRWPRSNAAESQPNVLQKRWRKGWPRSNAAESRPNALQRRQRKHWPWSNISLRRQKMAFVEYDAQTIASWDAAVVEVVALGAMVLTELKATPKLRYGGPPPPHFSPPLTAKEVTKLDAATLDKQRQAAAQEKALADEANKQRRAAARDKALADKANKQRCHESAKRATTLATKVLAKDEHNKDDDDVAQRFEAYSAPLFARVDAVMAEIRAMDDGFGNWAAFGDEILAEEDDKASAPTMPSSAPPTAVSPTPHHPTTYKDAVLATMGGSLPAKSLVVASLSRRSTTVNDQPQTACRCSQPHRRVGRRHGPQAPNPQEHILCGRQHRPHAPNQSTVNGWA